MPSLADHQASRFVKILYVGASGTGKTGSLVSLIEAGYKLRIIDLDNGLDALFNFAKEAKLDLSNTEFEDVRDQYTATSLGPQVKRPKALVATARLLDGWTDGTNPSEWGEDYILVIDSLTALGKAAFEWAKGQNPTSKDPRQWYNAGQQTIDSILATITDASFATNVIVCTHIDLVEDASGAVRGFASSLGKALGPKIPRHFNTMLAAESKTMGPKTTRKILTLPTSQLDLKNPAPMRIDASYPLETGMVTIFEKLKGK